MTQQLKLLLAMYNRRMRYSQGKHNQAVHRRQTDSRGTGVLITVLIIMLLLLVGLCLFFMNLCSQNQQPGNDAEDNYALVVEESSAEPITLTITFAGDCTLGTDEAFNQSTSFNAKYNEVGNPAYFLQNVADLFGSDDLTIVNMEGTLTESKTRADKTFAFKGPAEYASILTAGNVEAASMANNHSKDYGEQSYTDTIEALDAEGITSFGYDRIAYLDVKGVSVALIGAYELAEGAAISEKLQGQIAEARDAGAQLVLVYIHWGIERDTVPNETQMLIGHDAIDAGADLVVGSHPHVIQGYEIYNGRYIVYSLGNFSFGGNSNPSDKDCMIFQQTFTVLGDEVEKNNDVDFIACSISSSSSSNNYQPTIVTGDEKARIEAKIQKSSDAIATMAQSFSR